MDTILVTGAKGFFASRFIEHYKDKYNIIGLGHGDLDITDEKAVLETVLKYNPTYLVHAAAVSDTGTCERNPELSFQINVKGSVNVAKACASANTKLIYLSSDQIYNGNVEVGPYSEECPVSPNTVYGNHKFQAENEIFKISPESVVLRLTWLFGLPEKYKKTNSNIIWNTVKAAMKNEPIKLPVHEFRGITYIYDLVENFERILKLPGGIYNTGSESNLSTYEMAKIVLKEMGLESRIEEILIKDTDRYKTKDRDLRISNQKLKDHNICFASSDTAIGKCLNDFLFKV